MKVLTLTALTFGLASCLASRIISESGSLQVTATGVRSIQTLLGHRVQAGTIAVTAGSSRVCDVTIDLVKDSNGNGTIGDDGDETRVLHASLGEFRRWERSSFQVDLPKDSPKAWLRVRGWPCPPPKDKQGPAPIVSAFEVRADGLIPQIEKDPGLTLRLGARVECPHALTLVRSPAADRLALRVDDLRASRGELWSAYWPDGRPPARADKPDCVGALVLVDATVLVVLAGQPILLPYRAGKLGTLRVVSFDSMLRPVGDWTLGDLAF